MKSGHGESGLRSFTNITYDELQVGSTATVSRRISQTEVDALALVSGDVDAFHLASNGDGLIPGTTAKAVGGEAIISGLLSRRMPGPGTTLLSQELSFKGAIGRGRRTERDRDGAREAAGQRRRASHAASSAAPTNSSMAP